MTRELARGLNQAILALAPAHIVRDIAPASYREMIAAPGIIWAGGSERTIYGDAKVNYAFRAWHDLCHRLGGWDFSLPGEIATCSLQCRQLRNLLPRCPQAWLDILIADAVGQARYASGHDGQFPVDQASFVLERIGHRV